MKTDEEFMSVAANHRDLSKAREAFTHLFDRYHKPIISYLWQSLTHLETAQDLSHEVFLKAFKSRKMYRDQYRFTTWLWTIAKRTLIDHQRKKSEVLFEDISHDNQSIEDIVDHTCVGLEDSLILKVEESKLRGYFLKLTEQQREVLSLQIFAQMSLSQISELIDINLNTVKSLAKRAKESLLKQAHCDLEQEREELERVELEAQ